MMKVFEANITHQVSDFLNDNLKKIASFEKANQKKRLTYDNDTASYFFIEKMNFKQFLFSDKNWC